MDNSYRFGKVEVYCEGYDYPEDPYILRGSCGVSGIGPDRQNTSVDNWELVRTLCFVFSKTLSLRRSF